MSALGGVEAEPAPEDAQSRFLAQLEHHPFVKLLDQVLAIVKEEGENGKVPVGKVLPLLKAQSVRPKDVIASLKGQIFWSHPDAECEMLLRTEEGKAQHPNPLPEVYMPMDLYMNIFHEAKRAKQKAKLEKLATKLGWNRSSDKKVKYGALRDIVMGMKELFYDPHHIYTKESLDGIVHWPPGHEPAPGKNQEAVWAAAYQYYAETLAPSSQQVKNTLVAKLEEGGGVLPLATVEAFLLASGTTPDAVDGLQDVMVATRDSLVLRRDAGSPAPQHEALVQRVADAGGILAIDGDLQLAGQAAEVPQLWSVGFVVLRRLCDLPEVEAVEEEKPAMPALKKARVEKKAAEEEVTAPAWFAPGVLVRLKASYDAEGGEGPPQRIRR